MCRIEIGLKWIKRLQTLVEFCEGYFQTDLPPGSGNVLKKALRKYLSFSWIRWLLALFEVLQNAAGASVCKIKILSQGKILRTRDVYIRDDSTEN